MVNNKRRIENIALSIVIVLLTFYTYYTLQNFNDTSNATINAINEQKELEERVNKDGIVLGHTYEDIAKKVPLPPSSEIISVDNQDSIVSATILSDLTEKQLNEFYSNFFTTNNWNFIESNTFEKDRFYITIQIEEGLVRLSYQDKN